MNDLRLVATQTRFQLLSIVRNRRAMIFSVGFPVALLILFNSIFTSASDTTQLDGATVTAHAYFTGAMLAYAIMLQGFSQLAIVLVTQRETGQLKRYRGTPVPSWTFIGATVLRVALLVSIMAAVLLSIARLAYGVSLSPAAVGETALYVLLGTATMCSLGIAATSLATDADTASAALPFSAVLLSLISGMFIPIDQLPDWLAAIGRFFPVYHMAAGLQTALASDGHTTFDTNHLLVLGIWTLGGVALAVRRFRWEPLAAAA